MTLLSIIEEGERRKNIGMEEAADHAEEESPQWKQRAFNLLVRYLSEYPKPHQFQAEDFRNWCEMGKFIQEPPSKRAYGSIVLRAAKQGLIKKIGHATVKNVTAHRCFATLWESI